MKGDNPMAKNPKDKPLFTEKNGKTLLLDFQSGTYLPTADLRTKIAKLSQSAPRDRRFEQAFIASKIRMAKTHAQLGAARRDAAVSQLRTVLPGRPKETPPPPGGVGYGVFYTDAFRSAFATGTVLAVDFLAPTRPGGNVSTWLYLTATNRAVLGVEAFVLYKGQNKFRLRVFDWARTDDYWQTNIGYSHLDDYITTKYTHGINYQVLSIQNQTYVKSGSTWTNNVWLQNYKRDRYDLIYSYEYTSSEAEQKNGWVGSWGPIVETFEDSYSNTNLLGFLRAYLQARDAKLPKPRWTQWQLLSPQQSYIRDDNLGFHLLFLDPNHTFGVY
jgi:hypothetical protein